MKGLKKQRRIQIIALAAAALALSTALVGWAMRDTVTYFRSPSQIASDPPEQGEVFRLGGLVREGSIGPLDGVKFEFVITDGAVDQIVHYIGTEPRPDLFTDGQGTIATGKMEGGLFLATLLLFRHDETYMPKEVIYALKEQGVYVEPAAN